MPLPRPRGRSARREAERDKCALLCRQREQEERRAVMSEWLRRLTRNQLGSARVGSNPARPVSVLYHHPRLRTVVSIFPCDGKDTSSILAPRSNFSLSFVFKIFTSHTRLTKPKCHVKIFFVFYLIFFIFLNIIHFLFGVFYENLFKSSFC